MDFRGDDWLKVQQEDNLLVYDAMQHINMI